MKSCEKVQCTYQIKYGICYAFKQCGEGGGGTNDSFGLTNLRLNDLFKKLWFSPLYLSLNALYNCITIEKQNIAKETCLLAYIRIEAKT